MSPTDDRITEAQRHFAVRFPQDYRDFLATKGGMSESVPPAGDFLVIDSPAELIGVNEAGEFQKRFPGAVVIGGDGARELLVYDFRQDPPPLITLDVSAEDWSSAIHQAASLSALLEQFPETGWKWDDSDVPPVTPNEDRQFPAALAAAMAVRLDRIGEDRVEFEPFGSFLAADETTDWFRAWTGNAELTGDDFRVFGQEGTGGYAAFWLIRPDRPLAEQPVVFLGSEGETGVVARDLGSFLWLLAAGYGPLEAATSYEREPDWVPHTNRALTAVAERFAPDQRASAAAVIEQAAREFPDFDDTVMALCR